LAIF